MKRKKEHSLADGDNHHCFCWLTATDNAISFKLRCSFGAHSGLTNTTCISFSSGSSVNQWHDWLRTPTTQPGPDTYLASYLAPLNVDKRYNRIYWSFRQPVHDLVYAPQLRSRIPDTYLASYLAFAAQR